ncbi:cenp-O kinetochore centromere component [Pyrenophora tritici-repentis]|uniref:Cenp-O kinetochore centromere component n=1 Tax=Pyrenophora tritici-repentis TaxID=45151 RepID=A0A316ZSI3_9PLEO|nr:cenp-O kinetochore centromere component [Pyrenophora tritici-repentis]
MEPAEQLDEDISQLQTRIALLQAHRANLSSVLLSQPHLAARLQTSNQRDTHAETTKCIIAQQQKRNLENVYRTCAGVTAYRVKDPDPNAINNGNILGVSIDVSIGAKFVETYHVLLSVREKEDKKILSIHKHTIPPCIPLQQLAHKWIPGSTKDDETDPEQDLVHFGRLLRKELVSWHMRVNAVQELRKEAGLDKPRTDSEEELGTASSAKVLNAFVSDDEDSSDIEHEEDDDDVALRLLDIETDAAVRQMTITLSDRRTVVMNITKDGRVDKVVCRTKDGRRDVMTGKTAIGPLHGLVRRLLS